MNDLKFAWRQLIIKPGFAAAAVLTLALGIGANTAVFSVVNGVLLRPLPYPQPDQLVTLWERRSHQGVDQERVSGPNYLDWRAQNTVFSDMGVSPGWEGSTEFNLVLRDFTVKVHGNYASASLFSTLGVKPLLGRTLLPEEDRKEGNQAAVLGYGLWQRVFAGDTNVLGQTLTVDSYGRRNYTIVGVMPPGFGAPNQSELWLPMGWTVSLDARRSAHWHNVIARLKPGVTLAQAQAEMNTVQARLKHAYPDAIIGSEVVIVPLLDHALGRNLRTSLFVLWGVVAGVLLIACANVANLALARAAARQKEMAVRLALGASRWRILRQLTLESLLLAFLGGVVGVLLAAWGLRLLIAMHPASIPRLAEVSLDIRALAFTACVSMFTGLLFGLAPAWHCSKADLNQALNGQPRGASSSAFTHRTRSLLVVTEVALALVLLVAAGLMLQSLARMLRSERGFNPEHLLTAQLDFSVSGFTSWVRPTATRPQVPLQELIERLRAYPGVEAVGAGSALLHRENQPPSQTFTIFGRPSLRPEEQPTANFKGITPDWLRAIGGRLLRGRDFTHSDTLEAPGVVLINQTLAQRYFPNQDPIGQYLTIDSGNPPLHARDIHGIPIWSEIVGVVSDIKSLHPRPESVPEVYRSHWQWPMQSPAILVRATGDPASLAALVLRETKTVIPNLPPPVIRTMDNLLAETVAQPRFQTVLLSLFGLIALALALVGLYGVLAHAVAQRTHEIGIRMALGAGKWNVLRLIIIEGMRLALIGIGIGVIGALAVTRVMRTLLYEITPADPLTLVSISMLLLATALLACWLPGRRAANVHPMDALRHE